MTVMAGPPTYRSSRVPTASGIFNQMDGWKGSARQAGLDVVDLSTGASDMLPSPEPLEAIRAASLNPSTYSYCLKSGTIPLLQAACTWYERRFGVRYDPKTEALCLIGGQEALPHLFLATCEPGDRVLICNPCYPSYAGALTVAGVQPVDLPVDPTTGLPDFEKLQPSQLERTKVMLLNYPSNPTAVSATNEFFSRAIAFCLRHRLLLIHDNPYVDLVYEGTAPSPLALPGGRDCCVEIFSISKSYHLAGYRLGWALGNAQAIAALEAVKAPIDYNQWRGIQNMGIACLELPEERVRADTRRWKCRAECLVAALQLHCGWTVNMPASGMFVWAPLPCQAPVQEGSQPHAHDQQPMFDGDDLAFCKALLADVGVAIMPGSAFGSAGKGYVRLALVQDEALLLVATRRIGQWLATRRQQ
mmetsp:Transcript_12582/g.22267  ORF Transcript_12582/g.22267 Transcript_12582/m.22267 type:complete len:417 (+) Transcript_12582:49-1299(+)